MFLLGSGISIPSHFPSTSEITDQVMSGKNIFRHTDSRYYISQSLNDYEKSITEKYLKAIKHLLSVLMILMTEYMKPEVPNYEILYYLVNQLHDFESGESVNIAIHPFINEVKHKLQNNQLRHIDLFSETENYIKHTVWRMLSISTLDTTHLAFLSDSLKDIKYKVNIGTLNHDLLLEEHLARESINFYDGFDVPINNVRYWKSKFNESHCVIKLHGSINWSLLRPDEGGFFDENVGIVLNRDTDHALSKDGELMRDVGFGPLILAGTFNKINEYTRSVFSELFYLFRQKLKITKFLIVAGYSFGDKGINTAILEWLYANKKNKIVIIHPNPSNLLSYKARYAIRKSYLGDAKNNFLSIPKKIEQVSWEEIKKILISK